MTTAIKSSQSIGPTLPDIATLNPLVPQASQLSMFSLEDSPVRTSQQQAVARVSKKAPVAASGLSLPVLLAKFDPALSCWKTLQQSLPGMEPALLLTLPRWGMTRSGELFRLQLLALPTGESAGGVWPTPQSQVVNDNRGTRQIVNGRIVRGNQNYSMSLGTVVNLWPTVTVNGNHNRKGLSPDSGDGLSTVVKQWATPQSRDYRSPDNARSPRWKRKVEQGWSFNLNDQAANWSTPTVNDSKNNAAISQRNRHSSALNVQAVSAKPTPDAQMAKHGAATEWELANQTDRKAQLHIAVANTLTNGQLNPCWVEQLQGYPLNWTEIED